jgi:hypothetical protein
VRAGVVVLGIRGCLVCVVLSVLLGVSVVFVAACCCPAVVSVPAVCIGWLCYCCCVPAGCVTAGEGR